MHQLVSSLYTYKYNVLLVIIIHIININFYAKLKKSQVLFNNGLHDAIDL